MYIDIMMYVFEALVLMQADPLENIEQQWNLRLKRMGKQYIH